MKLFLKILLFIVTMIIITVEEVESSTVDSVLREETSSSFIPKSQLGDILFENHNTNSYLNKKNVVTYSEQVKEEDGNVAKGGSKTLLLAKLDNFPNLKNWVNQLDGIGDVGLISKLDNLENSYLSHLNTDIAHSTYGQEIKTLLKGNPDDLLDVWKRLKDDPAYSWELSKEGGSQWERWSQREFFKDITRKGKAFEETVCLNAFKNRTSKEYQQLKQQFMKDFGKNLDDYDMYSQVQLYYSGNNYFVADQLFVKYTTNQAGKQVIDDILVLENKLSASTPLTTPQNGALRSNSYRMRNIEPRKSQFGTNQDLKNDEILNFENKQIKWYKVHDGTIRDAVSGINKIQ